MPIRCGGGRRRRRSLPSLPRGGPPLRCLYEDDALQLARVQIAAWLSRAACCALRHPPAGPEASVRVPAGLSGTGVCFGAGGGASDPRGHAPTSQCTLRTRRHRRISPRLPIFGLDTCDTSGKKERMGKALTLAVLSALACQVTGIRHNTTSNPSVRPSGLSLDRPRPSRARPEAGHSGSWASKIARFDALSPASPPVALPGRSQRLTGELRAVPLTLSDYDPLVLSHRRTLAHPPLSARVPPARARPCRLPPHLTPPCAPVSPKAVCADGSSPAIYARRGFDPSIWLVYLESGPICYDDASCQAQLIDSPSSMSSKSWPTRKYMSGIFSAASPGHVSFFADASVVLIGYCSGAPFPNHPHQSIHPPTLVRSSLPCACAPLPPPA